MEYGSNKGSEKGRGLTNAEAASKYGLAPILDDAGSVATLHHSQQKEWVHYSKHRPDIIILVMPKGHHCIRIKES